MLDKLLSQLWPRWGTRRKPQRTRIERLTLWLILLAWLSLLSLAMLWLERYLVPELIPGPIVRTVLTIGLTALVNQLLLQKWRDGPHQLLVRPARQQLASIISLALTAFTLHLVIGGRQSVRVSCGDAKHVKFWEHTVLPIEVVRKCESGNPLPTWHLVEGRKPQCEYDQLVQDHSSETATVVSNGTIHWVCPKIELTATCPEGMTLVPAGHFRRGMRRKEYTDVCIRDAGLSERECELFAARMPEQRPEPQVVESFCLDTHEVRAAAFVRWVNTELIPRLGGQRLHKTRDHCANIDINPRPTFAMVEEQPVVILASGRDTVRTHGLAQTGTLVLKEDGPIGGVPYDMARRFCNNRVIRPQATTSGIQSSARLPTEQEWEYATRGSDMSTWVSGERPLCREASFGRPPQGAPGPNDLHGFCLPQDPDQAVQDISWCGVHELGGSMSEWTSTPASGSAQDPGRPACLHGGQCFVVKGAGREDPPLPAATSMHVHPHCPWWTLGFRCASTPMLTKTFVTVNTPTYPMRARQHQPAL